jgi:hypothetical protein
MYLCKVLKYLFFYNEDYLFKIYGTAGRLWWWTKDLEIGPIA